MNNGYLPGLKVRALKAHSVFITNPYNNELLSLTKWYVRSKRSLEQIQWWQCPLNSIGPAFQRCDKLKYNKDQSQIITYRGGCPGMQWLQQNKMCDHSDFMVDWLRRGCMDIRNHAPLLEYVFIPHWPL